MTRQEELNKVLIEYYMPYAMKVITDRALPDVKDGLKPIARRILWTMWSTGLRYNTQRDKCVKIVGDVLKIHNHGDISVYNALSLLTEENESLLHAFIDGEGAFGKVYSKDSPSAMRYTFARLNKFSEEMFKDIDKDIVKFIGEDKKHLQPLALSNTFPNILLKPNSGMAVGEACNWCSFNLSEIVDLTCVYINNKDITISDYLKSPDFSTGAYIIVSQEELNKIYSTGRGKFTLRAKYRYNKQENTIEVYEIPYNTTVDNIISNINSLITNNRITGISDVRDATGFDKKLKKEVVQIDIELKRGTDVNKLMQKLYKFTTLQTSFSCNFNCLVNYKPKVLGIKEILDEWLKFRKECISKSIKYDLKEKFNNLHFLKGLEKVLLDIDKAIEIIRHSKADELIIINLINEFKIDKGQADEISNMKLKNINQEYILKRIQSINELENEIKSLQDILNSEDEINKIIIQNLQRVKRLYGKPRKTEILYEDNIQNITTEDLIEDFNCRILYTKQNYIKKFLKSSDKQYLKENDEIIEETQTTNKSTLFLFSNKANRYKLPCYELEEKKPSNLGEYLPNILDLEKDEEIIKVVSINEDNPKGYIISVFENGKVSKVDIKSFISNNKKLQNCYSTESKLVSMDYVEKDCDVFMISAEGKGIIVNTNKIQAKSSRNTQGNQAMKLNHMSGNKIISAVIEPNQSLCFTLQTQKGKPKDFYLDDIANGSNIEKSLYSHLKGNTNTQGNFIWNLRQSGDVIANVIINK